MRLFHWLRRGMATLGSPRWPAAPPPPRRRPPVARPALWRVADADTTIYLFGTIHMLPPNYAWRTPALDKALAKSDGLIVETLIDEKNPQRFRTELAQLGYRNGLPPILERVAPDKRAALYARRSPGRRCRWRRLTGWKPGRPRSSCSALQFQDARPQGRRRGRNRRFATAFAGAAQADRPARNQPRAIGLLRSIVGTRATRPARRRDRTARGHARPIQRDAQGLDRGRYQGDRARAFNEEMRDSPELRDALLARRNANWAGWVERRMTQPGSVMVAVGAGHLAGDGSVQDMLQRRGYRVTRLQ